MFLSIIIPAYNESENIKATLQELKTALSNLVLIDDYKIIVVDDHSDDGTYDCVLAMQEARVQCLRLSRRSGSHVALRAGLSSAQGDAALCMAADGQDDPRVFSLMLEKWVQGVHVVWALRRVRRESFWVQAFAGLFYWTLNKLNGSPSSTIDLSRADFFLLDRNVTRAIMDCQERNTSLFGLMAWLGFKQDAVIYDRRERRKGISGWNFRTRFRLAVDWIVAFSGVPLKLMTVIGILVAAAGFLYALFIIIHAFVGHPVEGWASTMVVILVLGGLQMMMLGVIGEYLWRNLDETRKRPLYFIERQTFNG